MNRSTPRHEASQPRPYARNRRGVFTWRALPAVVVLLALALAVSMLVIFVNRAGDPQHPLSQLEQMFFGIYSVLVGIVASWLVSAYYAGHQARDQFQQLARPALRRVVAASDSAAAILVAINRRKGRQSGAEGLESLYELVEQHARVLDDAIANWQEVLPDDVRALQLYHMRQQHDVQVKELGNRLDTVLVQLEEMASRPMVKPADLAERVDSLRVEIDALRQTVADAQNRATQLQKLVDRHGSYNMPSARRPLARSQPPPPPVQGPVSLSA